MKSTEKQTLFLQENSMTVAELEPLTITSGGSSSNHSATLPPKKKSAYPTGIPIKSQLNGHSFFFLEAVWWSG